jgi:hypothetical protein
MYRPVPYTENPLTWVWGAQIRTCLQLSTSTRLLFIALQFSPPNNNRDGDVSRRGILQKILSSKSAVNQSAYISLPLLDSKQSMSKTALCLKKMIWSTRYSLEQL